MDFISYFFFVFKVFRMKPQTEFTSFIICIIEISVSGITSQILEMGCTYALIMFFINDCMPKTTRERPDVWQRQS